MRPGAILGWAGLMLAAAIGCGDVDSSPVDDGAGASDDDDSGDDLPDDDADVDSDDDDTWPPLPDDDLDDDAMDDDAPDVPILDGDGREIFLRGSNFMGLEYGGFDSHNPEDYQRLAEWGFNVVRIPIAWDYIEPAPGVYDMGYLTDVVEPAVGWAADAGLRVVLDFHQWNWCRLLGGNGMPRWICEGAFYEDWDWPFNILAASGDWWNHPEYQDGFDAAWDLVSDFFAGDDRVWAFDLFNEPMAGARTLPWFFENPILRPFYERLIQTIRANDPDKWIFIEPSIIHVAGFTFVMDPLPYDKLIFSPHLYPVEAATGGGYVFGPDLIRRDVRHARTEANRFGAPLFIGETGMVSGADGADLFARDAAAILDEFLVHWTWWCYHKDDNDFGLVDQNGDNKQTFYPYLARPYPRATMGRVGAMSFDPADGLFELGFANVETGDPDTRIWLPPLYYDAGFAVTCSDEAGTWDYDYDAQTRELFIKADPASAWHVISVRPMGPV